MLILVFFSIFLTAITFPASSGSYYPARLDDSKAVYLTPERFAGHGDGPIVCVWFRESGSAGVSPA
jgi:hypothetical protein